MQELQKYLYRYLVIAVVLILIMGTIFYHFVEKWSWVDAYYFSVVTLSTIGYGDLTPQTTVGKLFTTFYIFIGVAIITTFISAMIQRWKVRAEKRKEKQKNT